MLMPLRRRLSLLCVLVTGILLATMAAFLLFVSETQQNRQSDIAFQNHLNAVVSRLQSSHVVDHLWLSQLESANRLVISIQDNGLPLLFRGSYKTDTPREALLAATAQTALTSYGIDSNAAPLSFSTPHQVSFSLNGENGDRYQAAVAVFSTGSGWKSVLLLHDRCEELSQQRRFRQISFASILCALCLLCGFSYWFAGRAIRPVEEAQKRQAEFIAAASHELRSPLAVIQASVSAFADASVCTSPETPAQYQVFFDVIHRECRRMARLVDDLLFLANSDAGARPFCTEPVEADTLLMEVYDSFLPLSTQKKRKLFLSLPDGICPPLPGDRQRLFQALSILIDNAFAYTWEGGQIQLSLFYQRKAVCFAVDDDGIGISDVDKKRVFERFYRADPARSKKEHYGLGLSVAKEIAEWHGGTLSVCDSPLPSGASPSVFKASDERLPFRSDSHAVSPTGYGARFVLRLPLSARDSGMR